MIPAPQNIDITRGDHFSLYIRVKKKSDGSYVDLTGWTGKAIARVALDDAAPLISFSILFSDQVTYKGGVLIYATKVVTAALTFTGTGNSKKIGIWDLELTNTNGEPNTYLSGDVTLWKDIS